MKTVVVTIRVPEDTDIFNMHEEFEEQFGEDNVVVYENAEAFIKDQAKA